jgi:hypothetical protein
MLRQKVAESITDVSKEAGAPSVVSNKETIDITTYTHINRDKAKITKDIEE